MSKIHTISCGRIRTILWHPTWICAYAQLWTDDFGKVFHFRSGNHQKQHSETGNAVGISFLVTSKPKFVPASKIRGWTVMSGLVYHDLTATHTATHTAIHTATHTATHTVDWCIMTRLLSNVAVSSLRAARAHLVTFAFILNFDLHAHTEFSILGIPYVRERKNSVWVRR